MNLRFLINIITIDDSQLINYLHHPSPPAPSGFAARRPHHSLQTNYYYSVHSLHPCTADCFNIASFPYYYHYSLFVQLDSRNLVNLESIIAIYTACFQFYS
jgi:hypothetical protein